MPPARTMPELGETERARTPATRSDVVSAVIRFYEHPAQRAAIVAFVAFFILFARRFAQLLHPQVWDEEGRIITQMVASGPLSFAIPMNGYLIVLSRVVSFFAMLGPFVDYPRTATLLTWMLIVAIMVAIALVPSRLRGGPLLVAATLLVPSDPEVFGIPLYIFWWTIPLLYACYFWTGDGTIRRWRIAAIVIGGLSAPAIVPVAPLFILRAVLKRSRDDITAAAVAVACALVQAGFIIKEGGAGGHLSIAMIGPAIEKLVGGYLIWNYFGPGVPRETLTLVWGLVTLAFIGIAVWRERHLRPALYALMYLWLTASALSIARVDVNVIDQAAAGPRYYFLPFVIEGWILVQIAAGSRLVLLRWVAAAFLIGAMFNALPVLSRTHDDLRWSASLAACAAVPDGALAVIPIEFDGHAALHWSMSLSGRECRRLEAFGLTGLLLRP